MNKRLHIIVEGRVQGVCYRMCARDEALRLGVTGWVRNVPDGRVEVVAEGDEVLLAQFLIWCNEGPSYARVLGMKHDFGEPGGGFDGFEVRY